MYNTSIHTTSAAADAANAYLDGMTHVYASLLGLDDDTQAEMAYDFYYDYIEKSEDISPEPEFDQEWADYLTTL